MRIGTDSQTPAKYIRPSEEELVNPKDDISEVFSILEPGELSLKKDLSPEQRISKNLEALELKQKLSLNRRLPKSHIKYLGYQEGKFVDVKG